MTAAVPAAREKNLHQRSFGVGAALTSIGVLGTDICLTCRLTASTDFKVPGVTARL